MPKRIRRKRTKGWREPDGAVYVGRGTKWGNDFAIEKRGNLWCVINGDTVVWREDTRTKAVDAAIGLYIHNQIRPQLEIEPDWLEPLRGKDLMCFCSPDQDCHADILLELANR